jgi:hypothetical protein
MCITAKARQDFLETIPIFAGLNAAALRLIKVESDINGILPAGGGPLPFISFLP